MRDQPTDEWSLYQKSKDYKMRINLYETVDRNERFYAGDQWNGVVANDLPTPVFNIFKRCINYFLSALLSQAVKLKYEIEGVASEPAEDDLQGQFQNAAANLISKYSETLWEKLKMDTRMREALLDAAISGDMDGYIYWDPTVNTGQSILGVPIEGDISFELVDNVNIHFGNPNDPHVERQPWIIISFRELVSKLREEAKRNDIPENERDNITSDQDYHEQSGDMSKIEMDNSEDDGKTTALLKLWKDEKTGSVWYTKSTRTVKIAKKTDMRITRYPVAHGNWDRRKNSYHGQAVGTGLVPNQLFINKMFAMVMLNLMNVAFPKAVYNKALIPEGWSNQIGQAIPVTAGEDITKVAAYLQPGNMSSQVMAVIDAAISYTKDLIGVTDVALGNVKPDNTSAIIAVQQASFIPLENIKANLYQWVEDIGNIWLDMMIANYGLRSLTITEKQGKQVIPLDFSQLQGIKFNLKVDVGPSSYWSEITAIQTLDNLLNNEKIDFVQYLERIPDGMIPDKESLIEEIKAAMQQQAPTPPPPSMSIAFKDLPIAGRIQAAAQHGIQLTPQDFEEMQQIQAILELHQQNMNMQQQQQNTVPGGDQGAPPQGFEQEGNF